MQCTICAIASYLPTNLYVLIRIHVLTNTIVLFTLLLWICNRFKCD